MLTATALKGIVDNIQFGTWAFRIGLMGDGFFLQAEFTAPDNATGDVSVQRGRKWYVSSHATESEVVLTVLKAVLTALEHEAREQFTYRGVALFGPHVDVHALMSVAEQQERRAVVVG